MKVSLVFLHLLYDYSVIRANQVKLFGAQMIPSISVA